MKFKSTTGEDLPIALISGHTAVVTPEGVMLDKRFHKEAIARGCVVVGLEDDEPVKGDKPPFNREAHIEKVIRDMLESSDDSYFTQQGLPKAEKLNELCGFTVSKEERETIWTKVESSL